MVLESLLTGSFAIDQANAFIGDIVNVSETAGSSTEPTIAVSDNGKIYIVWSDNTDGGSDIFFSVSDDGGLNFSIPKNISNNASVASSPQIVANGDNVYVVWQGLFGDFDVYFTLSQDAGDTFSDPLNLSSNTGSSTNPQIAILDGSSIHVVWQDDDEAINSASSMSDIAYRVSSDNGQNFSSIINISNNDGLSTTPRLAVAQNGNVYVAWQDTTLSPSGAQAILFSNSTDGGNAFDQPAPVSALDGFALISNLRAEGDGTVYISWSDFTGSSNVFFVSSNDAGASFSSPFNISQDDVSTSTTPEFAVAPDGTIWFVWSDGKEGGGDIFVANSTDNSVNFSDGTNLSNNELFSFFPQIAISNNGSRVYVVWQNELGNGSEDIFFSGSLDGGQTFSSPANVAINPELSTTQVIAMLEQELLVVWSDSSPGNSEILFRVVSIDSNSITIEQVSDSSPRWGTNITATGIATSTGTHTVTVDWGDGSESSSISIVDNTWMAAHSYNSSAVGERTLVAKLADTEGNVDATSSSTLIEVQKRLSSLELGSVGSVIQGEDVTADGELVDAVSGDGLGEREITFNGTGSANILNVLTNADGSFQSIGASPSSTSTLLTVQAHFAGDGEYEPSDSEVRTYDAVSPLSSQFLVSVGSPSVVNLTGFGTTIEFDSIIVEGVAYVSECDEEPQSDRYLSLGLCLVISTSAVLADNSAAHLTMSFAGIEIPGGHTSEEIDIFHQGITGIIDITESKDTVEQTVVGRTTSFSKFIAGVALHDPLLGRATRQQVYVTGDSQTVIFYPTVTRTVDFDSSRYEIGSAGVLTITDRNSNLDDLAIDAITATLTSSSDSVGIDIILTETGRKTGIFTSSVLFTESSSSSSNGRLHVEPGDEIKAEYTVSNAPFKVVLDDVTESGMLQISPYTVTGVPWPVIGDAYQLDLIDGSISPSSGITITASYANVDDLDPYDPIRLILLQRDDTLFEPTWIDITTDRSLDQETVTGFAESFSQYAITDGSSFPIPGGGGGGLPRPGTGIILDAVATIAGSNSGSGAGNGGGGGGGTSHAYVQQMSPGQDAETTITVDDDIVTLRFESLSSGQVKIEPRNLPELENLFGQITEDGEQGIIHLNGMTYSTVGTIFDVDGSRVEFSGLVSLAIPYDESMVEDESSVRLLHYDEQHREWEDATTGLNPDQNVVMGMLDSLSPVVAAEIDDGTFGELYFTINPLDKVSADTLEIERNVNEAVVTINMKNVQRTSQTFVLLVQVTDSDGVTQSINWQEGLLNRGQSTQVVSMVPEMKDSYAIQIFVWSSLDRPQPLSRLVIGQM